MSEHVHHCSKCFEMIHVPSRQYIESKLAIAKVEIENLQSLVESNQMAFNHREFHLESKLVAATEEIEEIRKLALGLIKDDVIAKLESETKRMREALKKIESREPATGVGFATLCGLYERIAALAALDGGKRENSKIYRLA